MMRENDLGCKYPTVTATGSFGNMPAVMPIAAMQYDVNSRLTGMTMDDQNGQVRSRSPAPRTMRRGNSTHCSGRVDRDADVQQLDANSINQSVSLTR